MHLGLPFNSIRPFVYLLFMYWRIISKVSYVILSRDIYTGMMTLFPLLIKDWVFHDVFTIAMTALQPLSIIIQPLVNGIIACIRGTYQNVVNWELNEMSWGREHRGNWQNQSTILKYIFIMLRKWEVCLSRQMTNTLNVIDYNTSIHLQYGHNYVIGLSIDTTDPGRCKHANIPFYYFNSDMTADNKP